MFNYYRFFLCLVFLFAVQLSYGQDALQVAKNYLQKNYQKNNLVKDDVAGFIISDQVYSKTTGVHHIYFQQALKDVKVHNAIFNLAIKDGKVVHSNHTFIKNLVKKVDATSPKLSAKNSVVAAAKHLDLKTDGLNELRREAISKGKGNKIIFDNAGISRDEIPTELIWIPVNDGKAVKLAWSIIINDRTSSDWWDVKVDAQTGEIISKHNFTIYCNFGKKHIKEKGCETHHHKENSPQNDNNRLLANNDYNVFDYPLESPSHGSRSIVNSPYTRFTAARGALGATNGWHHTSTNNYTYTRGNNVWSQEDANGNNGTGASPNPGASLDFNYPFDFFGTPAANQDAAITNLFYWNNLTHDVLYNYGFDEPCGNFQASNVDGLGGAGNDFVYADAQDGSGTDNANFSTPGDGTNGRMQMFLWSAASLTSFDVNSPASVAGPYGAIESGFSTANKLADVGPITGDLVLANHIEACTANPITNGGALSGNIAVIDRGNCAFTEKVKNAENAGAIAVVVCNNVGGSPIVMGGTDNTITIPAVMLSMGECATIKAEMASNTVNITMAGGTAYTPDGDFDNGIIAHEYGHGWSIRSTGGPGTSCLSGDEQQGEGWSDFLALMLCTDWASLSPTVASANIPRGIGTYAVGQPTTGGGIRPFMYSYDMANINSYAEYANVGDNTTFSIPHGVGSMWCTILWDMTWEIIFQDGYIQSDIWDTSTMQGNVAAFKLVHEGLKLQPCSPGFVTSRDAILEADELLFAGKYRCAIWKAFARRGVGVNADQGSSASVTDGTADYAVPSGVELTKTADKVLYDQGEVVTYNVTATCGCADANNVTLEDVLPSGVTYVAGSATSGGTESGGTVTWSGVNLAASSVTGYSYQATVDVGTASTTATVVDDDFDGSAPAGSWSPSADWSLSSNPPGPFTGCSGFGYFAPDNTTASDESLVLSFSTTGPTLNLSFTHKYDTEATWDGGIVEISNDGGTNWTDLGSSMTSNGYNATSQSFGIEMFTGDSGGCITTTATVNNFCGDILIRFRMLCDASVGGDGWIIDDVFVTSTTGLKNTVDAIQSGSTIASACACIEVSDIVVPVELAEFTATPLRNSIMLNWTTLSETNNKGFEIERSTNQDRNFENIGWVRGNNNSSNEKTYDFEDQKVRAGVVYYYRLKQVDHNGDTDYSDVVSASIGDKTTITLFPNPAKGQLTVLSSYEYTGDVTITLRTVEGKVAKSIQIMGKELKNGYKLNVEDLESGVYLLETRNREFAVTKKLILK